MQREFGPIVAAHVDRIGTEIGAGELRDVFHVEYIGRTEPFNLLTFHTEDLTGTEGGVSCVANIVLNDKTSGIHGKGNGPVAAFVSSLNETGLYACDVVEYHEHALRTGSDASAMAYVCLQFADGEKKWGVGTDTSIDMAAIHAVCSALNRKKK